MAKINALKPCNLQFTIRVISSLLVIAIPLSVFMATGFESESSFAYG